MMPEKRSAKGVVLLVDDERSIRLLVGNMLEQIGFDVVLAEDGLGAVELFESHHTDLAAVMMDMTMPNLNGVDAMRKMRVVNPGVPILLVSGYTAAEVKALCDGDCPDGTVHKPFRIADLNRALLAVMHKD